MSETTELLVSLAGNCSDASLPVWHVDHDLLQEQRPLPIPLCGDVAGVTFLTVTSASRSLLSRRHVRHAHHAHHERHKDYSEYHDAERYMRHEQVIPGEQRPKIQLDVM